MEDSNESPECDNPKANFNIPDKEIMLAAIYVEDAKIGRRSDFKLSKLKLYEWYIHPCGEFLLTAIIIAHLLLALFEDPAVPSLAASPVILLTMEWLIVSCYAFRLLHIRSFISSTRFWTDKKNSVLLSLILFCFLDMIISIVALHSGMNWRRLSRPLRPLFAVNFPEMRQIRRSFRNLRRTLPDVFNVLVLLFFSLSIFALMAFKLFGDKQLKYANGEPYFDSYFNSFFDLYVLVTTANNPDIMMPAFDNNMWYVWFFVVFLILCFFIYMNIILAVIYNNYRKHLKNEVKKSIINKKMQLSRAFDLISFPMGEDKHDRSFVTKEAFTQLMKALKPARSVSLVRVLWVILDSNNTNQIEKNDFLKLADLLNVEVREVVSKKNFLGKHCPAMYNSKMSVLLITIVKHKFFRYAFDLLTVGNAIVIGISQSSSKWDDPVEWIFLSLFVAEILLKFYALGTKRFFSRIWNIFDLIVIGSAFLLGLIEQITGGVNDSRYSLDVLLVLRVLRLVKLVGSIQRFKVIVLTINKILPSLLTYGSIMLIIYYTFAIIGMEIFGGKIHLINSDVKSSNFCGNVLLNGTEFWREHYCNNNFNDLLHALVVMFQLTVVNQWHVIAGGFVAVTNIYARIFFMVFHLLCVVVILNIFTAFVLEVFMLEYCATQGRLESQVERKIHEMGLSTKSDRQRRGSTFSTRDLVDSDTSDDENSLPYTNVPTEPALETNVRFHISKKIRSVEVLLQKMFESELTDEINLCLPESESTSGIQFS